MRPGGPFSCSHVEIGRHARTNPFPSVDNLAGATSEASKEFAPRQMGTMRVDCLSVHVVLAGHVPLDVILVWNSSTLFSKIDRLSGFHFVLEEWFSSIYNCTWAM